MGGLHLPAELCRRIYDRRDLASQGPVRAGEGIHNLAQRDVADDQQINVAALLQLVPRRGSENGRRGNPRRERCERPAQHVHDAGRLRQERQKLREHG